MARWRVLVTEPMAGVGFDLLRREAEVLGPLRPGEALAEHLSGVHGLIVRLARVDRLILTRGESLRVVGKHGMGVDNIDVAAATERGIVVFNTPRANSVAVAEHALAMVLSLAKRLPAGRTALREGRFAVRYGDPTLELMGKTLGLVGAGGVGSELARICRAAFAMEVVVYDPYLSPERVAALGARRAETLAELLEGSDVVSLHVPLTEETRGLIGERELARMRPGSILINTSRGGVVVEEALLRALREGRIAGAGLDVFDPEPPPPDHPLFELDNVVASPHVAGLSDGATRRMAEEVARGVLEALAGERPAGTVNAEVYGRATRKGP